MFSKIKLLNLFFILLLTISFLKPIELSGETLQDVLNGVIVVGAHGRAGGGGGINDTIKIINDSLVKMGVPDSNVYEVSWHSDRDWLPGRTPDTEKQLSKIRSILRKYNRDKPTYLVLFGHSYGGWLIARLSRRVKDVLNYTSDVVFLLDAVIPTEYILRDEEKKIEAIYGVNYYQDFSFDFNPCNPISALYTCAGQISCGIKHFRGLSEGNFDINYKRDANGGQRGLVMLMP